jgi:hypothetical protein
MMISRVGFSIFVCGNRKYPSGAAIGPGTMEEFAISARLGRFPIPFGASGWAAEKIWNEVMGDQGRFYGDVDVTHHMQILKDSARTDEEYIEAIFGMIKSLSN